MEPWNKPRFLPFLRHYIRYQIKSIRREFPKMWVLWWKASSQVIWLQSSDRPWKRYWGPLWRNMQSSATHGDAARVPGRNSPKECPDRHGGPGQVTTCPYKPQSSLLEICPQFPAFAVRPGIRACGIVRAAQESRTLPQGRVRARTGWSRYEE